MQAPADSPFSSLQQLAASNQALLEKLLATLPSAGPMDIPALMRQFAAGTAGQRRRLLELEEAFYSEHRELWAKAIGDGFDAATQPDPDPRFDAPEWRELSFFRYLREAYQVNVRFLLGLGELAELEPGARRRLQFLLRQIADAMAPTNFAATNPEVIRLAAGSGGESLASGLKLLSDDLARGRISMSDEKAYEVGRNIAITPGSVVLENDVMQLIQYAPSTPQVRSLPLLIVPPFINKYYILDLQPDNSFVRFCVERGFTTFIVSWRNVPPELGTLSWDDYVEQGVLAPIEAMRAICGAEEINALGFCVGGTLLATALAVLCAKGKPPVRSLTLLATLLDFSETGDISVYIDREAVDRAEADYRDGGVMPGGRLATAFATLRANDLVWYFVVNNYLKGVGPRAFDLLYWNGDGANVPGRLYAWYLRNMYLENSLRVPGKLAACGVPLDLGSIALPAYVLATREDHIVPWQTAFTGAGLLGGRTEFVLGASGHVAGIVNPAARNRRHYWTGGAEWTDSQSWLANATQHAGSWWSHWAQWLDGHAGTLRDAPATAGSEQYPVIEAAPGRYVREK
jgi:polyhydroxyalkanoate synthase